MLESTVHPTPMKPIFAFVFTLLLAPSTFGQLTYIPDDNFEQSLINDGLDNVLDDYVLTSTIDTLTVLNLDPLGIISLDGIEAFIALEELICRNNNIQVLDLGNNVFLEFVNCENNSITDIEVSNCSNLTTLIAENNNLNYVNLSQNPLLEVLVLDQNWLGSIDLQANTQLKTLAMDNTLLTSIDLSNNDLIESLDVSNNQLASLDLTNLTNLTAINVNNCSLTQLDLTANTALESLFASINDLTTLDLQNNLVLDYILCTYNELTSLFLPPTNPSTTVVLGAVNNPNLLCIQSDDPAYVLANWNVNIEPFSVISTSCSAGINEFESKLNIYPNPSEDGWVSIQLEHAASYSLYDLHGKLLQEGEITTGEDLLDFSAFGKGMYLFQVNVDGEIWTERIELL